MIRRRICVFGEVLFDHFPDGTRVLGGAPFNVAWHLQAFGLSPHFISRVGKDPAGEAIRNAMQEWGMDTSGLQTDPERATGRVEVSFVDGEPAYDIVHPCSYDAIEADAAGTDCGLLYHGSLGLRDARSRKTLAQLVTCNPKTVFVDVNLRPPWWQKEQVQELLHTAEWVKLNAEELNLLHAAGSDTAQRALDFLKKYGLHGLLLTHGAQGAELFTASGENFAVKPKRDVAVSDTVGAGDAFASVMILGLVSDWPTLHTLQRAQDFASAIVSNHGATVSDPAFYQSFVRQWTLGS
jgi:fructokinase